MVKIFDVALGVILILGALYAVVSYFLSESKDNRKKQIKIWLRYAVIMAEQKFKSKTGKVKLSYVYNLFLEKFPRIAKYISVEEFEEYVNAALQEMNDLLSTNSSIKNIVDKNNERSV